MTDRADEAAARASAGASDTGAQEVARLKRSQRADRLLLAGAAVLAAGLVALAVFQAAGPLAAGLVAPLVALALFLVLTRRLRRDLALAAVPIPDWWEGVLEADLPYFACLAPAARRSFLRRVQVFLADQRISGIDCEPDETDRLLVAGAAVMLVEGYPGFRYPNTREILIYPTAFDRESYEHDDEGDQVGQVLHAGPVILSLPELRRGFTDEDWTNVAVHEMAHVLDQLWSKVPGEFGSEYDPELARLLAQRPLQKVIRRGDSPIDDYALEDPQEFFAVTTEVFFEDPQLLQELHPEVYTWLAGIYRQDPATLFDALPPLEEAD